MLALLEYFIDLCYFYCKNNLLYFCIFFIVFIILPIVLILYGIYKIRNKRYFINKLIYKSVHNIVLIGIGFFLYLIGLKLEIDYAYFNSVPFVLTIGSIILYTILLCLMYQKVLTPILQNIRWIQLIVSCELFLLANTQHLELLEALAGILGISSIEVIITLLENSISNQNKNTDKKQNKENDYPSTDLYPTRKKQLENFIPILKQQKNEPYAIMISGEWGMGKTSFVQALEKKLIEENLTTDFIWIYAGSEKTISEVMSDIFIKIIDILEKNNIFIEHKSIIEKYFLTFSDLIDTTNLKAFTKIINNLWTTKSIDEQEYLNNKLRELNKPIYLIVDDLDRCEDEYQNKMFSVIRESMNLHNCKVIFVVDKNKFSPIHKEHYIEKYVSYTLELCKVSYQEIALFFIDSIFNDVFIQNMNFILLKDRNVTQIKDLIYKFPTDTIIALKNKLSKEKEDTKEKENSKERVKSIVEFQNIIFQLENTITISRKVKNYLKNIKDDIILINKGIGKISKEFQKENWLEIIIQINFIKNFMSQIFFEIKLSKNLSEFFQRYDKNFMYVIFNLSLYDTSSQENNWEILNYIIYQKDTILFSEVQTLQEHYLTKFYRNEGVLQYINIYINCLKTYSDLNKILFIYNSNNNDINSNIKKYKFIDNILTWLAKSSSSFKTNTIYFLDFSKNLIDSISAISLTLQEKELCISKSYFILMRIIRDNKELFYNILTIFFDITIVEKAWNTRRPNDINELYDTLKDINEENNKQEPELDKDLRKILYIKIYFNNLENKLNDIKYKFINNLLDVKNLFSKLDIVLDICIFWDDIENYLNGIKQLSNHTLDSKYFDIENNNIIVQTIFKDSSTLIKSLENLKSFYKEFDSNTDKIYDSNNTIYLLRILYNTVSKYETDPDWFDNDINELIELVNELVILVCKLDKGEDDIAKDDLIKIKIYSSKLNEYFKKG